jgi:hypothetical protein
MLNKYCQEIGDEEMIAIFTVLSCNINIHSVQLDRSDQGILTFANMLEKDKAIRSISIGSTKNK